MFPPSKKRLPTKWAPNTVAVNTTSALHIACLALGLGSGDWLWTVPNTFVASANCARYCGAKVDFVDIDPQTWKLSVSALAAKLEHHRNEGKALPKVLVPVHFSGQPTDQEQIWELAQEFGFKVLEDASHAIGAQQNGEPVGSCRWSDITVFSFHPVKIVTSGEGGMALTNDSELAWKMRILRTHGITREADRLELESLGSWYYEQQILGFNYRMTELQAGLGRQLERLDELLPVEINWLSAMMNCWLNYPFNFLRFKRAISLFISIRLSTRKHLRNIEEYLKNCGR